MINGVISGILWALNTVILGVVLVSSKFTSTSEALFLAPFISTFMNDVISMIYMFIYNCIHRNIKSAFSTLCSKSGLWIVLASIIGGPIGTTGYVLSITYMGSSIAAVASAIYPAIGVILAKIFLKEKMTKYQFLSLLICAIGIYCMSYSPEININNFWLGLLGTLMCSIGWGVEAVIIAFGLKDKSVDTSSALFIRYLCSSVVYAAIILPCISGWNFTISLFSSDNSLILLLFLLAAIAGTMSYQCYYRSIDTIGASKAMSLNITYTAWSVIFSLIIFQNFNDYAWYTYLCIVIILSTGLFAAVDVKDLFHFRK